MTAPTSLRQLAGACGRGGDAAVRLHVRTEQPRMSGAKSVPGAFPRARQFHTSAPTRDFDRDVLLGVSGNFFEAIPGESIARYDAAEMGRATDYPVGDAMLALAPASRQAVRADFAAAAARLHERKGEQPPSEQQVDAMMRKPALDAFGFTKATRESVVTDNKTYLESYWHPAVQTALQRGGTITLHPGYFCFHRHFRDITYIAADTLDPPGDRAMPPAAGEHISAFFNKAVVTDLHERGGGAGKKPRASVTSAELFDALEGRSSAAIAAADSEHMAAGENRSRAQPGLEVLSADGRRSIDTRHFRRLYQQTCDASRTHQNLRHLRDTGRFTPEARSAVEELQRIVHGTPDSLPTVVEWHFQLHISGWGLTNV